MLGEHKKYIFYKYKFGKRTMYYIRTGRVLPRSDFCGIRFYIFLYISFINCTFRDISMCM